MDTLLRHWAMLHEIPRHPQKIASVDLQSRLRDRGYVVNLRTIQRDLIALSRLFPLVSDSGKPQGWAWAKGAPALDIPAMDAHAAVTLKLTEDFLEPLLPPATLSFLQPYFTAAERTLGDGLLAHWTDKVRVVPRGQPLYPPDIDERVLSDVYEALLQERKMTADYRTRERPNCSARYEINPLGLVWREATPYVIATLWQYDDVVQLLPHRMSNTCVLDAPARKPIHFDLDAYVELGAFEYPEGETLRLQALFTEAAVLHLIETPLSEDQTVTPHRDGQMLVQASVLDTRQLRWWLLGFGDQVEIVGPKPLRRWFTRTTRAAAQRYEE